MGLRDLEGEAKLETQGGLRIEGGNGETLDALGTCLSLLYHFVNRVVTAWRFAYLTYMLTDLY